MVAVGVWDMLLGIGLRVNRKRLRDGGREQEWLY